MLFRWNTSTGAMTQSLRLVVMVVGIVFFLTWGLPWSGAPSGSPASAQDPADETLDDSAAEPGTRSAAGADSDSGAPPSINIFQWRYLKDTGLGWLLLFLIMSLATVYLIVEHSLTIRKGKIMPEAIVEELEQKIARGEFPQAVEFCSQPENYSLASEVILAGLQRYTSSEWGFAEFKTAAEEEGENQTAALYRKTEPLAVIGAIAPMFGLLGTVQGLIVSFYQIVESKGPANPAELAHGVGMALFTTLLGLLVAIPAMIAFSFFRNKIDSLIAETGKRVERALIPLGRRK